MQRFFPPVAATPQQTHVPFSLVDCKTTFLPPLPPPFLSTEQWRDERKIGCREKESERERGREERLFLHPEIPLPASLLRVHGKLFNA